ncbi:MAG TPA: glycosyltransferase [Bacteroidales bacterium]|nr:glycosyltransferase [Bacteroidales bacterium]
MSSTSGISVIICTYNGANRIIPTLSALVKQNDTPDLKWEIIIIDNNSDDNTSEIAKQFFEENNTNIDFRIITENQAGKANALYRGYNEAKYDLMLVCDDDNWLQAQYISTVYEIFKNNPEIALLGGYGIAEFQSDGIPNNFDKWQHCFACGKFHQTGYLKHGDISIWGAGSVLKKSVWMELTQNGFQFLNSTKAGKAMGEDVDLANAVSFWGYKLYFDERLWFNHDLSGGRLTDKNLMTQVKRNYKNSALLLIYLIANKHYIKPTKYFFFYYFKMLISLSINLMTQVFKKDNSPTRLKIYIQLTELATHPNKYYSLYKKIKKMYCNKNN